MGRVKGNIRVERDTDSNLFRDIIAIAAEGTI